MHRYRWERILIKTKKSEMSEKRDYQTDIENILNIAAISTDKKAW